MILFNIVGTLLRWYAKEPGKYMVALACIIAGLFLILVVVNPMCWVSGTGNGRCTISDSFIWSHYPGKGAALQFAGASIAYSLILLVLGLSGIYETGSKAIGETRIKILSVVTLLCYLAILLGLYIDFAHDNGRIPKLLNWVIAFMFLVHGWVLAVWGPLVLLKWCVRLLRPLFPRIIDWLLDRMTNLMSIKPF